MRKEEKKIIADKKSAVLCCAFLIAVIAGVFFLSGKFVASENQNANDLQNEFADYSPKTAEPVVHTEKVPDGGENAQEQMQYYIAKEAEFSLQNDSIEGEIVNREKTIDTEISFDKSDCLRNDSMEDDFSGKDSNTAGSAENEEADAPCCDGEISANQASGQSSLSSEDPGIAESDVAGEETEEAEIPVSSAYSRAVQEELLKEVSKTAGVKETAEGVFLVYEQPEVPSDYHLTVKAEVYDKNGAILCRFVSDGGWLANPENYDASAKEIEEKLDVKNLQGKSLMISIRVSDANVLKSASIWMLEQDEKGNRSITTAFVE